MLLTCVVRTPPRTPLLPLPAAGHAVAETSIRTRNQRANAASRTPLGIHGTRPYLCFFFFARGAAALSAAVLLRARVAGCTVYAHLERSVVCAVRHAVPYSELLMSWRSTRRVEDVRGRVGELEHGAASVESGRSAMSTQASVTATRPAADRRVLQRSGGGRQY